ncbi:MAG TPA: Asp-tRNA(Asn)/Glu-tRNA(Gln) amidotransferase GatCAB subunit B, partial [Bacteroidetes bacterium]|nr:Asp-tRNA(Asn)/Glu-tRNA(Gln) amidotransferase GatCAB subunit B [Bacteroidota bacterium]
CDANVSVRLKGAEKFGQKVEVKNMNSIRNVKRAIEHEIERQIEMLERGERIAQDTRSFDALKGTTTSMRSKEEANDYRYFPEPDLPPIIVEEKYVSDVRAAMPKLPEQLKQDFISLGLSEYDASILTEEKETANYFQSVCSNTKNTKAAANWVMGPVKSFCNEQAISMNEFSVPAKTVSELIEMIDAGGMNFSIASQKLFPELLKNPSANPKQLAGEMNLIQQSDEGLISKYIDEALAKYPEKVAEYKGGKTGVLGLFVGEVMKLSNRRADPKLTNKLLLEKLNS